MKGRNMRVTFSERLVEEVLFLLCVGSGLLFSLHIFVKPLRWRALELESDVARLGMEVEDMRRRLRVLRAHVAAARFDPLYLEAAARQKLRIIRPFEVPLWTISELSDPQDASDGDAPQSCRELGHKSDHPISQDQQGQGGDKDRRCLSPHRSKDRIRCIRRSYSPRRDRRTQETQTE